MDETAKIEDQHRQNIADSAEVPVEEITPTTAETPLELAAEGIDVARNTAEEVGGGLFGGGTTEVRPSSDWKDTLKKKIQRKVGPDQELIEK